MFSIEISDLTKLGDAVSVLIEKIGSSRIVAFYGKMGAGKTTMIKEICRQLGVKDVVSSPTFSLINEYHRNNGKSIFHFDFYRINKLDEAYDLGYEEYFYSDNLCLIEWPEKIESLLPDDTLILKIEEIDGGKRVVELKVKSRKL